MTRDDQFAQVDAKITALETRTRSLEDFKSESTGALKVVFAWATFGLSGLSFLGLIGFVWHYATTARDVTKHEEQLAKLDAKLDARDAKIASSIKEISAKADETRKNHDNLRAYVTVLMDRDPKGAPKIPEVVVYRGRVLAVASDTITILDADPGEPARKFILGPESKVSLNGKSAKLAAIEARMTAEIIYMGKQVTQVNATSP
jgi:hypothetical protein